jgi:ribonuclease Z
MTTEIVLTGTGVPYPARGRAGAGTLVRSGSVALQFDAGRATALRLVEAGTAPHELSALFVTHVHSDHVVAIPDLVMSRWLQQQATGCPPLPIVAAGAASERFLRRMLDPYEDDIALRIAHVQETGPHLDVRVFEASAEPAVVWRSDDEAVTVTAVAVHHEPVAAVAYRVDTPDAAVVISGDTKVCAEVEALTRGADVLVHEACRSSALRDQIAGTIFEKIFSYHADTVALGGLAARADVPHLVLTHLIPAPEDDDQAGAFEADIRQGGYAGIVTVGTDLAVVRVGTQ